MALLDSTKNLSELSNIAASRVNLEVYSWSEVYPIGQTYNRTEINAKIASGSDAVRRYFKTSATDALAWYTLGSMTLSDGTYSSINFQVQINKGNLYSWGNANKVDSYQFLVKMTRSAAVQDNGHSIEIIGPKAGMLRGRIYDNKYFELQFSADAVGNAAYGYSMNFLSGSETDWSTATWLDPMDKVPGLAAPGTLVNTTTTGTIGIVTHLQGITQNGYAVVGENKLNTYGAGLTGSSTFAGTQNTAFNFPSMPSYTGTSDSDLLPVYNSTTGAYQKITKGDLIPDAAGIRIKGNVLLNAGNTGTITDDPLNTTITARVAPNTAGSADPAKGYSFFVINSSPVTSLITGTAEQFELSDQVVWTGSAWKRLPAFGGINVRTFKGRSGDVVAAVGDYTASMVNGATAGGLTDRTVQQALDYKPDSNQTETITGSWTFTPIVTLSNGATVPNPANTLASLIFGWNANIPRLRVGGSGTGSAESFEIQGLGDAVRLSVGASESYIGTAKYKIWHAGNSNLSTVDWSVKDLVAANNVYLANNKFVYGKDTVGSAKTVIGIDATNKTIVGNTSNQLVLYTASNNPLVSNGSLSYALLHDGNIASKNYAVKTVNETITGLWTHSEGINMSNNKAIQGTARGTKLPVGNKYNLVKLDNDDDILVGADTARMGFFSNDPANLWLVSEIGNPARQYRMYNEGFKPTAADVGAAPTNHTHAYAPLTGAGTSGSWPISVIGSSASTTGNAATATTLQTARTIAISGAVTGTATSFNGEANITIAATALNASNLSAGTVPDARISGSYTGMTNLTGTGTVDFSKFYGNAADTVTAPSFSWTTDTDTGIYSPAADQLAITTGGVQRALFSSAGVAAITFTGALSGNATTATTLQTARTLTIGSTGKSFNGSANVAWSLAEIGAAASSHTHPWAQITGIPVQATRWPTLAEIGAQADGSYAAASHTHAYAPLTGAGTSGSWPINVIGSSASTTGNSATATTLQTARILTIGSNGKSFNGSANVAWSLAEIGAQPAGSYAAASHTHSWSQVTGAPVYTTRWPDWGEVSGKPATMPPAAHDHLYLRGTYVGGGLEVPSYFGGNLLKLQMLSGTRGGVPDVAWSDAIWMSSYSGTDVAGSNVLVMSKIGAARIGFRQQAFNSAAWGAFNEIYHSGRKPTPAEIGAQPAGSYAAASHTHPWAQITGVPVQATRWPNATEVGLGHVPNTVHSANPDVNTVAVRDSAADINARLFRSNYTFESSMAGGLAFRNSTTDNYIRFCNNPAAIRGWLDVAPASHTHTWAQISGIPAYATRWPSPAEIGAQAAGSYAAASHTHPWAQITGVPVQATRWPNNAEVGLGNVGNYTSSTGAYANTHALRDGNGDLVARQFHGTHVGDGSNLTNLQWARLVGVPATATRWPTAAEAGATAAPYTGTDSDFTNYPLGTYLFATGYRQGSTARNQRKTLYISVAGGYGKDVVTSDAGVASNAEFRALSGAWAARGVSSVDGGGTFGWHYVTLFQRVA